MKLGTEQNDAPDLEALQISLAVKRVSGASEPSAAGGVKSPVKMIAAMVCVLAGVGAAVYWFVQQPGTKTAAVDAASSAAQTVTVTTAKLQDVADVLNVTGPISAWDPLNVGAEIGGLRITKVMVEEGDRVKRGQPLAYLNSALLNAQLMEAKAKLVSSRAALTKAIQPNRQEQILALRATLEQAQSQILEQQALRNEAEVRLKDAEHNAKRALYLEREGATSTVDTEAKLLAANVAREQLASANAKLAAVRSTTEQNKQRLLEAERGGRAEDVQISRAENAQIEAQIAHLQEQINQTVVRAPDDGVISKRMAHIGETSTVGSPLFSIIRLSKLELQAQVPDTDLRKFVPGQKVSITAGIDGDADAKPIQGTVRLVSAQVDNASRVGTVRIDVPSNEGLKPGMFAKGEVKLGRHKAIVLPPQAVVHRNGESFVFSVHGDRGDRTPVKVGLETDKFVEVTEGLENGQQVVAQGARFLSDHDLLRIVP